MKKLFTYISLCLLVVIMFSACTSHLTVTKRHHRNGYYVSFDRGYNTDKITSENETALPLEKNLPAETNNVQSKTDKTPELFPQVPQAGTVNETTVSQPQQETTSAEKEQKRTGALKNGLKKIKQHVLRKPREIKKITHSGEGYSLLWIVIVAILILWAISLLSDGFGLGGIIHVLLVIALILFILWLLHLI